MPTNLSIFLDAARWIAAFLVMLGHVRHLMWVDFARVENPSLFSRGFYFLSGLGHEAVVVFFVISGFLVGGVTLSKWQEKGVSYRDYAAARLSRIHTVLVPALLLGLVMDYVGLHYFDAGQIYSNPGKYDFNSIVQGAASQIGAVVLMGNLLGLQTILVPVMGTNGPLWSLANEWWYYVLFGLLAGAWFERRPGRILKLLAGALILSLLPLGIALWGLIWVQGMLAFLWVRSGRLLPHPAVGAIAFLLVLGWARLSHGAIPGLALSQLQVDFQRDFLLGLAFVTMIAGVAKYRGQLAGKGLHGRLAGFSYSLYLFHFPLMVFLVSVLHQVFGLPFQVQPGVAGAISLLGVCVALMLTCHAFARGTEDRTPFVRSLLLRAMGRTNH